MFQRALQLAFPAIFVFSVPVVAGCPFELQGVSVSGGAQSLFTVAWTAGQLLQVSDWALQQGEEPVPVVQWIPLHAEQNVIVRQAAVLASERLPGPGLVAASTLEGDILLSRAYQPGTAWVRHDPGVFRTGVGLSFGVVPQLAVFSTEGISVADVPSVLNASSVLKLQKVVAAKGIVGGISLQKDDFLGYDAAGVVRRYRSQRVEKIGVVPGGIRSLSGYLDGIAVRVWAVDRDGGVWKKTNKGEPFTPAEFLFPSGVTARSVSASGQTFIEAPGSGAKWVEGFFSHRETRPRFQEKVWIERLFLVGSDGKLYSPFPQDPQGGETGRLWLVEKAPPAGADAFLAIEKQNPSQRHNAPLYYELWSKAASLSPVLRDPKSGLAKRVSSFGVAPVHSAQLIFLVSLAPEALQAVLDGKEDLAQMREVARLLLLPQSEFRKEYATNSHAKWLIGRLASHFTKDVFSPAESFFSELAISGSGDESLYLEINALLRKNISLWKWDLARELKEGP